MVYNLTGKQHRIRHNNDIYIASDMALVLRFERPINTVMHMSSAFS